MPKEIESQLQEGAALALSISEGKDSQALVRACVRHYQSKGYTGPLFAIHADL